MAHEWKSLADELEEKARDAGRVAAWLDGQRGRVAEAEREGPVNAAIDQLRLVEQEVRGAELRLDGFAGDRASLAIGKYTLRATRST